MMNQVRKLQRGFTLLEVLITVLILSIGLLGLAGLQLSSLKNSHSAYLRSQATYLAYDMMDRMRANRPQAIASSNNYNKTMSVTPTTTGVAQLDMADWLSALTTTLPGGDASISQDASDSTIITITVQWEDSRVGASTAERQFVLTSKL